MFATTAMTAGTTDGHNEFFRIADVIPLLIAEIADLWCPPRSRLESFEHEFKTFPWEIRLFWAILRS